jgi:prepilin-type N-terminal cleavage/methylation domain-containing protein
MRINKTKKGFTLVELLIAVTVFAIFMTSIMTLIVDMYRSSRRITLEEEIYQDMRAMMKQLTYLIEDNAIDYEEYYREATGDLVFGGDGATYVYGNYAKLFYDFGPDGEGALCNTGAPVVPGTDCVLDRTTLDRNLGQNPIPDSLNNPADSNAFCGTSPDFGLTCLGNPSAFSTQNNLYLINENGDRKTIIISEAVEKDIGGIPPNPIENVLSIAWLNGSDSDSDDISDTWTPGAEFVGILEDDIIGDGSGPSTATDIYDGFIPISSMHTHIVDLKFYIHPLEDPYKGFAETDPATGTLVQPHVTIIMTAKPSVTEMRNYFGPIPSKTLQTTIFSKVRQNIVSY